MGILNVALLLAIFACVAGTYMDSRGIRKKMDEVVDLLKQISTK